jgi:hypothetical protein
VIFVKKNRRIFYLATAVSAVMGIAVACSFPEPRIVDEGVGPDGEGPDATGDSTTDGNPQTDGGNQPDVVELDAPPPIDATSDKPAVDANCNLCDCDNDGYLTKDAAVCDAGGARLDCDDLDSRANPDSGFRDDLVTNDTKGDWNCDTKYNLEYPTNFKCSDYKKDLILGSNCVGLQGFVLEKVPCGAEEDFVICKDPGVSGNCLIDETIKKKQRCK